jgi:poly-gamma-glutamate capsule biosynthesis protein CapA/YwtB (metallophosphatase superfamily)
VRLRWAALVWLAAATRWAAAAPIAVPIYIEDSHAGSFYWLARQLDLDAEYTLVHFDAHSDASAIFDSDKVRERLRRVSSLEERRRLLEQWRERGAIQCYNWIEPLMPAPISRMIWVPGPTLSKTSATERQEKAVRQFDGHLEAAPRQSQSFRERCRVLGFDQLPGELKDGGPIVVTIDLDYFAEVPADQRVNEFERVWKFVAECRNLRAVTIAISRPYLKNDADADDLARLALAASLSLPTATIQFEPFANVGPDRSLRAREFQVRRQEVPTFRLENASEKLRALLLANRERISVETETASWTRRLEGWEKEAPKLRLAVKGHEPSTDNIWRVPANDAAEVELRTEPWDAAVGRIEWIAVTPEYARCNLTANRADEIGFASGAPPRPRWRETKLPGKERTLSLGVARRATATEELGAIRVKARVEIGGRVRETVSIEIRRFAGAGFRAAITEQFGLPYLFGSGELSDGSNTGPETGFGADCANFVVYALRRQGRVVPWSNPKQLRKYLEPLAQNIRPGDAKISDADIAGGLLVHLGNHVAAVMEDRPPLGVLDRGDLVAHQLEGVPEILSLGQLVARRKTDRFDLLRAPHPSENVDVLLGGDVMLGRAVGAAIATGADPLAGIRSRLERASSKLVNLECVLSDKGNASAGKRYSLRAPLEAMRVLAAARISAVSLANNHAADFGRQALLDSIARLQAGDILAIGAGETTAGAYAPHFLTTRAGTRAAIIALTDIDGASDDVSIASARDRERVAAAIGEARANASFVLVFVHWGDENTDKVNERQRELARWLIDHGVDAVVGSHSHCVQPFDTYHGRPIIYSLGNLVFDGAPSLPNWNQGRLLEVDAGQPGVRPASFRLVPVQLDARGFPQLVEPDITKERRFSIADALGRRFQTAAP